MIVPARPIGWHASCDRVGAAGARLLASFDDDLFLTGQPLPLPYSIYVLYDVDDLGVSSSSSTISVPPSSARFLRLEARIGRPLFVLAD